MQKEKGKRIFICCAGTSDRCGVVDKLELRINGKTILQRTIDLIKEFYPDIPLYLITWNNEYKKYNIPICYLQQKTSSILETILFTSPYWREQNIFLTGDTVFYPDSLKKIVDGNKSAIYGNINNNIKNYSERFAVCINEKDIDYFKNTIIEAITNTKDIHDGHGGLFRLTITISGQKWYYKPFIPKINTNQNIISRVIFWNFLLKKLTSPKIFINLNDNYTTDIDTLEEYEQFNKLYDYGRLFPK